MKTSLIVCVCSIVLATCAFGQNGPTAPATSPTPGISVAASPTVSPSVAETLSDKIQQRIEKKLKGHHGITIEDKDVRGIDSGDIPEFVVPIVAITMLTVFGAPVLIVAAIMYFGFSKSRMMHRTVRMMVEKGQPVPAALLNPPPAQRQRSDMRRGVVLVMIGLGLMIFLGAVNGWDDGVWSLGIIPFLIGAGYLLVWKLEGKGDGSEKGSNPPPLP